MPEKQDVAKESRILFTAPWEPVIVRRGDALGLRALADRFADAVAPDLSNRVRDGRWVTILAWCLTRSHEVFHASGGRSVHTRAQQRERYAWLRPLELLWVARTIALAEDWRDRSLAGQRRVRPWYENDGMRTNGFGMTPDQFRAYRQTGMYGAYRLVFRTWPRMTDRCNGWTPGLATNELAKWLEAKLGNAKPPWPLNADADDKANLTTRSAKHGQGDKYQWWLKHWTTFDQGAREVDKNTLPRRKNDHEVLPEARLLLPLVFGEQPNGRRRWRVATEVTKASANTHIEVCQHLGAVLADDVPSISALPRFSRLADAGMAAMNLVAKELRGKSHVTLAAVAAIPEATSICGELTAAAQAWLNGAEVQIRHIDTAHRFANSILSPRPVECLRALLLHHEVRGGGLRWFVLRDGKVEPRTPPGAASSGYGFRLWSLCRLAVQCGVISKMPADALLKNPEARDDESSEANDE